MEIENEANNSEDEKPLKETQKIDPKNVDQEELPPGIKKINEND